MLRRGCCRTLVSPWKIRCANMSTRRELRAVGRTRVRLYTLHAPRRTVHAPWRYGVVAILGDPWILRNGFIWARRQARGKRNELGRPGFHEKRGISLAKCNCRSSQEIGDSACPAEYNTAKHRTCRRLSRRCALAAEALFCLRIQRHRWFPPMIPAIRARQAGVTRCPADNLPRLPLRLEHRR